MINLPNFKPFFGYVESVDDPLKIGRVQVKVFGVHSDSIPASTLPWFSTVNSNSASYDGLGESHTGYLQGSTVFGYFVDLEMQRGFVVGSLSGITIKGSYDQLDEPDVNKLAREEGKDHWLYDIKENARYKNIQKPLRGSEWEEPPYINNAKYPFNLTYESVCGHIRELDSTPGEERIHEYHKTGTYEEIKSDGSRVVKVVGDNYELIAGASNILIVGDCNITVDGNKTEYIKGDYTVQIDGTKTEVVQGDVNERYGNLKTYSQSEIVTDAPMQYHQTGKASGLASIQVTLPAQYNVEFALPAVRQFGSAVEFDEPETISQIPADYPADKPPASDSGEVQQSDTSGTDPKTVATGECSLVGEITERTKLSTHYTVGDLSTNVTVRPGVHKLRAQNGFTVEQIACNLQALCENILEPLRAEFGAFRINSAFRTGAARSQHNRGMAVDIQEPSWSNQKLFEVAKWAKENLPCDQVILEHSRGVWIHISFDRTKTTQRGQPLTMYRNKFEPGLKLYYT